MKELKKGQILGDFKILEQIGSGGMGIVYKACHKYDYETISAIKVIRPEFSASKDFISRFTQEERLLRDLSHPNIVRGYHFGEDKGVHYLVMEYVEGGSLRSWLFREKQLTPGDAVHLAVQMCRALEYAHGKGIIHRDIKPDNILLRSSDGSVLLTDFGLMKVVGERNYLKSSSFGRMGSAADISDAGRRSSDGGAKGPAPGTVAYMSPEQITGGPVGPRSDLYQVGAVIYESLTGEIPFGTVENPREYNSEISQELENLILKCLKKEKKRYASASELLQALYLLPDLRKNAAPPPSEPEPAEADQPPGGGEQTPPKAASFAFAENRTADTKEELLALCSADPGAAEERLYAGDIEKWLYGISEDRLAERAKKIREYGGDRRAGVLEFIDGRRPFVTPAGKVAYNPKELKEAFKRNKTEGGHCLKSGEVEEWLKYTGNATEVAKLEWLKAFTPDIPRVLAAFTGEDESLMLEIAESQKRQKISEIIAAGELQFGRHKYHEAIAEWERTFVFDKDNSEARGSIGKAKSALTRIAYLRERALALEGQGDTEKALKVYEELFGLAPDDFEARIRVNRLKEKAQRIADEQRKKLKSEEVRLAEEKAQKEKEERELNLQLRIKETEAELSDCLRGNRWARSMLKAWRLQGLAPDNRHAAAALSIVRRKMLKPVVIALCLAGLMFSLAAGCYKYFVEKAVDCESHKNWGCAVFFYKKALLFKYDGGSLRAALTRAEKGQEAEAARQLELAAEQKRKEFRRLFQAGSDLLAKRKYFEAKLALLEAISISADDTAQKILIIAEEGSAAEKSEMLSRQKPDDMALIPAGKFIMGSPEGDGGPDEHPLHEIYLDAFYIEKTEVTAGRYKSFVKATGRKMHTQPSWSTDSHPVVYVDGNDAAAYCEWAGGRLPTEAEWEKAARGGTNTKYSFGDDAVKGAFLGFGGDDILGKYAWYSKNSNDQAHTVGQMTPNQYGLYDIYGNVWERVSDWYAGDYYKNSPEKNPQGLQMSSYRVLRGGAWNNIANELRAANRHWGTPGSWSYKDIGFRCGNNAVNAGADAGRTVTVPGIGSETEKRPGEADKEPAIRNVRAGDGAKPPLPPAAHPQAKAPAPAAQKKAAAPSPDSRRPGSHDDFWTSNVPMDGEDKPAEPPAPAKAAARLRIPEGRILVPAGKFFMGSPEGEGGPDEHPFHEVYLDAFYIDATEVTAGRYKAFVRAHASIMREQPSWSTDLHPVVEVDWNEAATYCEWAGGRLPTEAEWEKAARGGTTVRYSFGDWSKLGEYAWYRPNSGRQAHPVGQKKPNQYGLYDMHGNAWEWVADWYEANYYGGSPKKDPQGPELGSYRILRGGSWGNDLEVLRTTYRKWDSAGARKDNIGFRCAYSAK